MHAILSPEDETLNLRFKGLLPLSGINLGGAYWESGVPVNN